MTDSGVENPELGIDIIESMIEEGVITGKTSDDVDKINQKLPPAFGCANPIKSVDCTDNAQMMMYSYANLWTNDNAFTTEITVRFLD